MKPFVIISFFSFLFFLSCSSRKAVEESTKEEYFISLTNNIARSRKDEPIIVSRDTLEALTRKFPSGHIPRLIGENDEEIPIQTDDINGDGVWDEISFTYSILPKYTVLIKVESVALPLSSAYEKKTNIVVYHPSEENTSRFSAAGNKPKTSKAYSSLSAIAWENDKIGFLINFYPESIKSILGKKTDKMILHNIDINSMSLNSQPWGRKLFNSKDSVESIGPGTLTFMNDSLYSKIENYDSLIYHIITQGPVRSTFKVIYKGIKNGESKFNLEEEITIWARQDGYQNKVTFSGSKNELMLAAAFPAFGLNSINQNDEDVFFQNISTFTIQKDKEAAALGILLPKSKSAFDSSNIHFNKDSSEYFVNFKIKNQDPVNLYIYAGWQYQDDKYKESEGFYNMMNKEANRLNNPIEVRKGLTEEG